jgi:Leucine-rich repeat (LRR) protein
LKELRILDLSGNSLLELPSEIAKLPSLEQLVLNNNPLQKQYEELLTV